MVLVDRTHWRDVGRLGRAATFPSNAANQQLPIAWKNPAPRLSVLECEVDPHRVRRTSPGLVASTNQLVLGANPRPRRTIVSESTVLARRRCSARPRLDQIDSQG
jgi:hypothetical protein